MYALVHSARRSEKGKTSIYYILVYSTIVQYLVHNNIALAQEISKLIYTHAYDVKILHQLL